MKRKRVLIGGIVVCVSLLWFGAVDWSWFVEDCPDCGCCSDVVQYRVFSMPVHETFHEYPTTARLVSRGLGVECKHSNKARWHKHRWWGLCVCSDSCINGIYDVQRDSSWYTPEVQSKLKVLARNDPAVQTEFVQRVLIDHDLSFITTVFDRARVRSEVPSDNRWTE